MNMAVDEALLEAVAAGESRPVLRFYGWQPACLSLGIAQSWQEVDLERCAALGWDVVRRPTGGRAILHVDELTYSVCAPKEEERVRGSILESYQRLSQGLVRGLRLMGLVPEQAVGDRQERGAAGPACFDDPADYEITIGGRKLVGSAQMRKRGVVLQHGTLPLYGDIARISEGLRVEIAGERAAIHRRLHERATTVEASLGRRIEFDEAAAFMQQGFAEALNLRFVEEPLTAQELARAGELRREKYGTAGWTQRR